MSETTVSFRVSPPVRPAPVYEAAIIFAATSLLFFACLYLLLPLLRLHHISWFTTYNLVLAAPMFILVGCAFLAYHLEGRRLRWPDVRDRFCLRKMSLDTWLWTAALAIFMFGGRYASLAAFILVLMALGLDRPLGLNRRVNMAFGVTVFLALTWGIWQAQPILTRIPLHALPSSLRDFLAHFARAAFMGIPLHGQWWIAFYYILVLGIWEYCRRGAVVARISATAAGSCQRVYGMGVTRSSVGRIPSILPSNRLGHDSHDVDMLCSRVCGSISKKIPGWASWPILSRTADSYPDRARHRPLVSPRWQVGPILKCLQNRASSTGRCNTI